MPEGHFEEVDLEKASRCLEINVMGTAAILQAFVASMPPMVASLGRAGFKARNCPRSPNRR